jgi:hypothetical protein
MFFLMRNLMVLSLAIFSSAAWSQQPGTLQPTGWPQILFWTVNPYNLQPQLWAQPTAMPRPGIPQALPFPTPFWLWPLPPQPSSLAPPSPSASLPTSPSPPVVSTVQVETSLPETAPVTAPAVQEETLTEAPAPTPATIEVSIPKPEPAFAEVTSPIVPIEVTATTSTIEAPPIPTVLDESVVLTEAEPNPASEAKTLKKARTAKKNVTKKVRKLCWKDGRLDVCP